MSAPGTPRAPRMKATDQFDEITVFGARGHSLMFLQYLGDHWKGRVKVRALIDDLENGFDHPMLGIPVIGSEARLRRFPDLPVLLTVAAPALRQRIAARLIAEGATLATEICADRANLHPGSVFGPGTVAMPWSRIGPNVQVGACAILLSSGIGHDVTIGAFATLAAHSVIAGHVQIGTGVNIAPSAVIANGTRQRPLIIGDGAEIGVGAAVLSDVPPGARMIGNPAMPIRDWVRLRRLARG
jgi:acyl-[acyl carrier protein]--UDP-N-acetylglucosamine O-acyltransferase